MKIFHSIIKTLLGGVFIAFCAVVATFFITVFKPDEVMRAVEIFKSLF